MAKKEVKVRTEEELDKTGIPGSILASAIDEINSKGKEHGEAAPLFQMIADLWSVYIFNAKKMNPDFWVTAHDVAQLMALMKISRSVYGYSEDNYVDAAGYASIAAMLNKKSVE